MPVNVNPIMAAIVEAADTLNIAPDDYINPDDGLKYCGKCHTPKEAYFPEQYRKNGLDKHPIACKCAAEERARREAEQRELERLNRIAMLRSEAFRDIPAAGWRFENAEVMTPQLVNARRYSENWDAFRQDGTGLLLFGNVGTGKSYAAGCIANALIEKMVSVLFVGLSDVVNRMQGNFGADQDAYMKMLMRPELLILDDLGAERNTSFGRERVFDVGQQTAADRQTDDRHHQHPAFRDAEGRRFWTSAVSMTGFWRSASPSSLTVRISEGQRGGKCETGGENSESGHLNI